MPAVQFPVIVTQPTPQSVATGAPGIFSVNATGSDLTYQWRRDGANIAGANASRYTLDNVQPADDGARFSVEVRNSAGSVVSSDAALQVAGPNRLSLLAGQPGGQGNLDGTDGRFQNPIAVSVGPNGLLYVVDVKSSRLSYGRLRTIDPVTGNVATVKSFASTESPLAMKFDQAGNRYDLTDSSIFRTTAAGEHTLFVGSGKLNYIGTPAVNGVGTAALFSAASDMAIDAAGNLYVADAGSRTIRKVDPAGKVTTLAGNGVKANVDGPGSKASFKSPIRLAIDRKGNLVVLDYADDQTDTKLRKVAPDGTVTTLPLKNPTRHSVFYGFGHDAGALTFDAADNLYLTDSFEGCRVRRIGLDGTVTDLAGGATMGYAEGKGAAARLCGAFDHRLESLTADAAGNLLMADTGNTAIRRITPAGEVTTIAGRPASVANLDGTGAGAAFSYAWPRNSKANFFSKSYSLVADGQGNVYVGTGDRIRKVTKAGSVTTLPTAPGAPAGSRYYPGGLGYGLGALVVSDNVISRLDTDGTLHFLAGSPGMGRSMADGKGAAAVFHDPFDLIMDGLGNVHLLDASSDPSTGHVYVSERKITPDGTVTSRQPVAFLNPAIASYADKDGQVWTTHGSGILYKTGPDGTRVILARPQPLNPLGNPTAITRDSAGNTYIAETYYDARDASEWSRVRRITPNGTESFVAGTANSSGVRLGSPSSLGRVDALAVGADGVLYLMTENAVLRLKQ